MILAMENSTPFSRCLKISLLALLAACSAAVFVPVYAQQTYPPRSVRLLVGFPPAGSTDIIARLVAPGLSEFFRQQFVVDNRPGAGGSIAAELAARAAPDGCTLLVVPAAFASNVSLYAKLPYDPLRDFAPITRIAAIHNVLVVHPSVLVRSVKELVALARRNLGQLVFASAGNGSASHLAMEMFRITVGGPPMLHVPHRGMGPAVLDTVGGHVDALMSTVPAAIPHLRDKRLRALAVASAKRAAPLPDVPTFHEAGYPDFEAVGWNAVLATAGTPYDTITRLNLAFVQIARSPEVKARLATQGAEVIGDTPDEFAAYLRGEIAKWAQVVKMSGAKID